ncbi:MAG: asparaginyl-tRNA synthetase [Patescibacteria group bacterium]|nr:asparaginyl-tRNA synthetase [Patescibacteria group bacterium]
MEECKKVFIGLCKHVFRALEEKNSEDLLFFLDENTLKSKSDMMSCDQIVIGFREALDVLYSATKNEMYKDFSLKNFGTWEEVKLTELLGGNVIVEKFPMLQIPFYHAIAEEEIDGVPVAKNADYILYGFRETVGAGERIRDKETLMKKADIFHLPKRDYLPYLESRNYRDYVTTSGFGL